MLQIHPSEPEKTKYIYIYQSQLLQYRINGRDAIKEQQNCRNAAFWRKQDVAVKPKLLLVV